MDELELVMEHRTFGSAASRLVPRVRSNRLLGGASPQFPLFYSQLHAHGPLPTYVWIWELIFLIGMG
jgi:hypothetical protein